MTLVGTSYFILSLTVAFLQIGSTPIWVPLTIILIIILLFWWGLTRNRIEDESRSQDDGHEAGEPTQSHNEIVTSEEENIEEIETREGPDPEVQPVVPIEPDDLKLIEGIGPKISTVLAEAGIVTFAQLAGSDPELLEQIVREDAGIKLADPSSWPEQAGLAAAGNWDDLEQLQEELHAGRKK